MRVSTTLKSENKQTKTRVLLHGTERLSKQQALPKSQQKWRSNAEGITSDTKIGNYLQK